jgi:hypothetical protein
VLPNTELYKDVAIRYQGNVNLGKPSAQSCSVNIVRLAPYIYHHCLHPLRQILTINTTIVGINTRRLAAARAMIHGIGLEINV